MLKNRDLFDNFRGISERKLVFQFFFHVFLILIKKYEIIHKYNQKGGNYSRAETIRGNTVFYF